MSLCDYRCRAWLPPILTVAVGICLLVVFDIRDAAAERAAATTRFPTFPLSLAVAQLDGTDVVEQAWLDDQVAWANRIFGKHGVTFAVQRRVSLADQHTKLETRADRHALGAELQAGVINCFVVGAMRDVDDPTQWRRGVHWRPRGHREKHFVVITSIAGPRVLAHELGHFFGNRPHSKTPGNIMSYTGADVEPFFDERQVAKIHRAARRFLITKELLPFVRPPGI